MKKQIVISADQLTDSHVEQIVQACEGWASCERLPQSLSGAPLEEVLSYTDIVVGWTNPASLLSSAVSVYLCGSAGYEAYMGIGLSNKKGFQLTNAGGAMGATIAEHCLAMQFALTRELPLIFTQQSQRIFQRCWNAQEIGGSTACIVGLGNSGRELARRCRALGQKVIGVCRTKDRYHDIVDEVFSSDELEKAVRKADHIFCLLPGGPETKNMFHRDIFAAMKPSAFYYTASRGSVTNEADLVEALNNGRIAGAGIDVFEVEPLPPESPLWAIPHVIVSPHSAGLSSRLNDRLTKTFIDNLINIRDKRPLHHLIPSETLK